MSDICIRAGVRAGELIRDGGLSLDRISTYVGPAVGPRWLLSSGFDSTLLSEGVLGRRAPLLLAGASAGAWRFAAWLQPEPLKSYRALMEAYTSTRYSRADTPATILEKLSTVIDAYLEDDALPFALDCRTYRLAVITARTKHLAAAENRLLARVGFGLCYLLNTVRRSLLFAFAERVVFYNGPKPPAFCLRRGFRGTHIPLDEVNFKAAILASGAIPLVVAGVRDIYGAPLGLYRDGGLIDYHLSLDFSQGHDDLVLFFHHQERIVPGWLDKTLPKRRPPAAALANVIMVHPTEEFVARLPGGKVPDRDDYATFMDDAAARIANWQRAIALAAPLGEQFLEAVASGRIRDRLLPITPGAA